MQNHSIYQDSHPTTNNILIQAAKLYQGLGYKIVPINAEISRPKLSWKDKKVFDNQELKHYFSCGDLALLGGENNIACIEFIPENYEEGACLISNIQQKIEPNLFERFVIQLTPEKHQQWLVRFPYRDLSRPLIRTKSGAVAAKKHCMDSYFLVYPSDGYTIIQGDIANIPILTEKEWIVLEKVFSSFDQYPKKSIAEGMATYFYISSYLEPKTEWPHKMSFLEKVQTLSSCKTDCEQIANHIKKMSYANFLTTPFWKVITIQKMKQAGFCCQFCGKKDVLQVHHLSYVNHGYEQFHLDDLIVLCCECHRRVHNKKEKSDLNF